MLFCRSICDSLCGKRTGTIGVRKRQIGCEPLGESMIRSNARAATRRSGVILRLVIGAGLIVGAAAAQDDEAAQDADTDEPLRTEIGECFTADDILDYSIFSDRSIYVRTRGRHFLLTTRRQCNDLQRAYNRSAVDFVPFGRRICPADGSHFQYVTGGRARICPIGQISEVDSREEARELAAFAASSRIEDLVTTEEIEVDEP